MYVTKHTLLCERNISILNHPSFDNIYTYQYALYSPSNNAFYKQSVYKEGNANLL